MLFCYKLSTISQSFLIITVYTKAVEFSNFIWPVKAYLHFVLIVSILIMEIFISPKLQDHCCISKCYLSGFCHYLRDSYMISTKHNRTLDCSNSIFDKCHIFVQDKIFAGACSGNLGHLVGALKQRHTLLS